MTIAVVGVEPGEPAREAEPAAGAELPEDFCAHGPVVGAEQDHPTRGQRVAGIEATLLGMYRYPAPNEGPARHGGRRRVSRAQLAHPMTGRHEYAASNGQHLGLAR